VKRPDNLIHHDVGALLVGIGTAMTEHNLCAGAALDGASDQVILGAMEIHLDMPRERAIELLAWAKDLDVIDELGGLLRFNELDQGWG
jgi:hypothetical protein